MSRILTLAAITWIEMLRRKDLYVLLILLAALLGALLTMNVYGLAGVTGYVKDTGLLFVWLLGWILALNTSVRLLPDEEQKGTLFPLLAKPVSRGALIVGKWLGAWSVSGAALLCFYLTVGLGVLLKGGAFNLLILTQAILLHLAALAVLCSIGIALSTRMNRDAAAVTAYVVTGAAFVLMPRIPAMLTDTEGVAGTVLSVLYYGFPHFELFDLRRRLIHEWGCAPWLIVAEVLVYGALLTTGFLALAWLGYRKRQFTRGAAL